MKVTRVVASKSFSSESADGFHAPFTYALPLAVCDHVHHRRFSAVDDFDGAVER